jgi:hypothetical protein
MMRLNHLPVFLLLLGSMVLAGCATVGSKSPPDEVKAFFVAANEANFLGVQCMSPKSVDLSGYTHLMGVKYPPTQTVDVLNSPPARPYQAFAVLASPSASERYDANLLESLKNKAKAIGADAIILCGPADRQGIARRHESGKIEAVAVKYRLEELESRPKLR